MKIQSKTDELKDGLPLKREVLIGGNVQYNQALRSTQMEYRRDCQGQWVAEAAKNLRITSFVTGELSSIIVGLNLACKLSYRQVITEIDSQIALKMITNRGQITSHNRVLVNKYKEMLMQDYIMELRHIYREANRIADQTTNWAIKQKVGVHALEVPPLSLNQIISADVQGASLPRLIHLCFRK